MSELLIEEHSVKQKLKQAPNFKSAGTDKIPNFWLKQLNSLHKYYAQCFTKILNKTEEIPEWLTEGCTYLLPKSEETESPSKYRLITCLPTVFKLLTGIITDAIYTHLAEKEFISPQQNGCKRDCFGAKDHLLVNKTITENAKKNGRNFHLAWIDYKKAFDSVPHSWILETLKT